MQVALCNPALPVYAGYDNTIARQLHLLLVQRLTMDRLTANKLTCAVKCCWWFCAVISLLQCTKEPTQWTVSYFLQTLLVHASACIHACACTCACMRACVCLCMFVFSHRWTHAYVCACVHTCFNVCVCLCMWVNARACIECACLYVTQGLRVSREWLQLNTCKCTRILELPLHLFHALLCLRMCLPKQQANQFSAN